MGNPLDSKIIPEPKDILNSNKVPHIIAYFLENEKIALARYQDLVFREGYVLIELSFHGNRAGCYYLMFPKEDLMSSVVN